MKVAFPSVLTGTVDEKHAPPKRPRPGRYRHVLPSAPMQRTSATAATAWLHPPGQKHRRGTAPGGKGEDGDPPCKDTASAGGGTAAGPGMARNGAGSPTGIPRSLPAAHAPLGVGVSPGPPFI